VLLDVRDLLVDGEASYPVDWHESHVEADRGGGTRQQAAATPLDRRGPQSAGL